MTKPASNCRPSFTTWAVHDLRRQGPLQAPRSISWDPTVRKGGSSPPHLLPASTVLSPRTLWSSCPISSWGVPGSTLPACPFPAIIKCLPVSKHFRRPPAWRIRLPNKLNRRLQQPASEQQHIFFETGWGQKWNLTKTFFIPHQPKAVSCSQTHCLLRMPAMGSGSWRQQFSLHNYESNPKFSWHFLTQHCL